MAFSTEARVRTESGFDGNSNVSSTLITEYLNQANGVVLSYVGARYRITALSGALFTGSQAENMLKRIEELLASGYLLIKEYGADALDSDKDGYKKVEEALELLTQIMEGKIRLLDVNGDEIETVSGSSAGSVVAGGAVSGENKFSVSDVY